MKKFRFSLATALKLRESQLQVERSKLQLLLRDEQTTKEAMVKLALERRAAAEFMRGNGPVSATDLRAMAAFSVGADAQEVMLQEQMRRHARLIREQQARVMQAERKVRLLEKLRDKKLALWSQEMEREIETAAQEAWLSKRHRENAQAPEESSKN